MHELYYISQGENCSDHLNNITNVCQAGGKLIQLRIKNTPTERLTETAFKAKDICDRYRATLIINDHIEVAQKVDADGVHLGKSDSSIKEARAILGEEKIIGGTANTLEDCLQLKADKADYIGLGPYRYTTTKKNLSPVLGIQGYKEIISKIGLSDSIPVYAIGGILTKDIPELLKVGLSGVAASGLLTHKSQTELKETLRLFE